MPWVRFLRDYDWQVSPRAVVAYKAGTETLVTADCVKAAVNGEAAIRIARPGRARMSKAGNPIDAD